jgi:hypothetical protein
MDLDLEFFNELMVILLKTPDKESLLIFHTFEKLILGVDVPLQILILSLHLAIFKLELVVIDLQGVLLLDHVFEVLVQVLQLDHRV